MLWQPKASLERSRGRSRSFDSFPLGRLARFTRYKPGEAVIYRVGKVSSRPGPRAIEVRPSAGGETYSYLVDKLWQVESVREDGKLLLRTRRGKHHVADPDAPGLRRPSLLERWRYRRRFPFDRRRS